MKQRFERITVLCGGVGASRFLTGLAQAAPPESISAVINTGDDLQLGGLSISPDVDIVTCSLAGLINEETGWGIRGDTFQCRDMLSALGVPVWFNIGDRDMALHLRRTYRLAQGATPTQIAGETAQALGVKVHILPMSHQRVTSMIDTAQGPCTFEEYLIQRRAEPAILNIRYDGAEAAEPTPDVLAAIRTADLLCLAPSNPFVSIGTILALPGIREALLASPAPVIGVSPIVSGSAIKGPAAKMLAAMGYPVSPAGVAQVYEGLLDGFVLDTQDADSLPWFADRGISALCTDTLIARPEKRAEFARRVLAFAADVAARKAGA